MRRFQIVMGIALAAAACGGGGGGGGTPDASSNPNDPDVPPLGFTDMMTWLGSGYYKAWTCEPSAHPQEFPSNHGYNRTCNNDILHQAALASMTEPFPVDAASVKELYDDCGLNIIGMAVSRKLDETGANGWYWYQTGGSPSKMEQGQGSAVNDCIGCHQQAGRDFTFAIVMSSGSGSN